MSDIYPLANYYKEGINYMILSKHFLAIYIKQIKNIHLLHDHTPINNILIS